MRGAFDRFPAGAASATIVSLLGLAGIGVLDYATGYEIRLLPLYFLPIALAAWRLPGWAALTFAALSAVTWLVSNWIAGRTYPPLITTINLASQLVAFAVVGYLVAELRRRLIREQLLGRQDPLTGLPNSRAFHEHGERILALVRRSAQPLTLAYLDLDNFKRVNDEHGHHEGDRALKKTGDVLMSLIRESDFAARLGGDEFVILLPNTDAEAARLSLERLHREVVALMRRNDWPVGVSIGAVTYIKVPTTLDDAVRRADVLMYQAKASGKNCIVIVEADLERDESTLTQEPVPGVGAYVERDTRRVLH